jgi:hypothetical protein
MHDSQLNRAERALQHSFMKSLIFNSLLVAVPVGLVSLLIRAMPDRDPSAAVSIPLSFQPVVLAPVESPLRLAGAWKLDANDRRFGGLSALAIDEGEFLAVSDRGSVARFSLPGSGRQEVALSDLRVGPGPFGKKWARDAESLARDPLGRGWWVGFEQNHSLWLYDRDFRRALASVDLHPPDWSDNGGAEGLLASDGQLLVLGQNGRDAIRIEGNKAANLGLNANQEIADAARAPDGSDWVLLRRPGLSGIQQSIAPLEPTKDGYVIGAAWQVPKGALDNFEGMTIQVRPGGEWRFWLLTDDDFRSSARTLLVALDYSRPARSDKSPAMGAGLSK